MKRNTKYLSLTATIACLLFLTPVTARAHDSSVSPDPGGGTGNATAPGTSVPFAAVNNSMLCFKVKDTHPVTLSSDLALSIDPHSTGYDSVLASIKRIKVKELCIDVEASPDPIQLLSQIPELGLPNNAWTHACYTIKLEDPKKPSAGTEVEFDDRFGLHIIEIKKVFRFCTPIITENVLPPPCCS